MSPAPHKIVYVIDALAIGGAQKQLFLLSRALPDNYRPSVVCLSDRTEPFAEFLQKEGIDVTVMPRRSHRDVGRLTKLTRYLSDNDIDVVHSFLDASNAYAYLAARATRRPVFLSVASDRLRLPGMRGRTLSWMLRRAEYVMVNSKAGERLLLEKIGALRERVLLIQNWIDTSDTQPRPLPDPGAAKTIGTIGRFSKEKRLDRLLDAFAAVRDKLPDCRLILMGDGDERQNLIDQSERIGVGDHVVFVEPSLDVDKTLRELDCFVITSDFEGLPNSVVEALNMGIPVVSNAVGDMPDLVLDGKTGVLVEDNRPQTFADAIVKSLTNETLVETVRHEGPALVEQTFSISLALEKLIPAYERMIKKKERRN